MAFADLADNQMVSFTDAQTGGFTLNLGQSHVTSDECMSKSQALMKYKLKASAFDLFTDDQLVQKGSWEVEATYYNYTINPGVSGDANCGAYGSPITLYSDYGVMSIGMTLYTDVPLTIPYDGGGYLHYYGDLTELVDINSSGVVTDIFDCYDNTPPSTPTSVIASDNGDYSINITWDASTDESGISSYYVFRNDGVSDILIATVPGNQTSYTDANLCNNDFMYRIIAVDNELNESAVSSYSSIITITGSPYSC